MLIIKNKLILFIIRLETAESKTTSGLHLSYKYTISKLTS